MRDAIFPHGIAKLASKLFESQKEVVKNKERPLGEVKWAMRSTANAQKPGTKLGGAGRTTSVGLDLVTNSMGAVLVIKNKRGILAGLAEGSVRDQATMSLLELEPVIFGGTEGIITFMRSHGLLAHSKNCIR